MENQVLVSRLVGRTAPSGKKSTSQETRVSPGNANIGLRRVQGLTRLRHLCRSQERPILASFCSLSRISRHHGLRSIVRKASTFVRGLGLATSAYLQILSRLCLAFADSLTHRASLRLSRLPEMDTFRSPSNLSEILDVLVGPKNSLVQSQESRESQAKPSQNFNTGAHLST